MGLYTATPAVGDKVTVSFPNAFGAWTSYTPTWSATGTAVALGNGTLVGAYCQIQKLVAFRVQLTMGSTTTYGTGQYKLTLPVAPVGTHRWHFDANGFDTSATAYLNLWAGGTGQTMDIFYLSSVTTAASTYVGQLAPMTWAVGDILTINGVYESA